MRVSDEKEERGGEPEQHADEKEGEEDEEETPIVVTYRFSAHAHPVQSLAYYDEDTETTLISGSNDRTIAFWDLEKTFEEENSADDLPSPMFKFNAGTEVRAMVVSKSKKFFISQVPISACTCSNCSRKLKTKVFHLAL